MLERGVLKWELLKDHVFLLDSNPSKPPKCTDFVQFHTILCVKWKITAKTNACTAATVILEPPLGKLTRIPGVNTKKSTAIYKRTQRFIMMFI
jgi:hypothetical protein